MVLYPPIESNQIYNLHKTFVTFLHLNEFRLIYRVTCCVAHDYLKTNIHNKEDIDIKG